MGGRSEAMAELIIPERVIWDTSCRDWEDRLLKGLPLVPDLPLFRSEADKALRIFKRLRVPDIEGNPTLADACGEWFFAIVAAIFGSLNPETSVRMIQEFFLLIPKGNAKTSYGGSLMVVALLMNRIPGGEHHLIAPTMKIADYAFKQAMGTILLDPVLSDLFHPQPSLRTITHLRSRATLQIKAADTDIVTGGKQIMTMIDETHEFAKKANAADIFVEIRGALGKRPSGALIQLTTQSKKPPVGVFKAELEEMRNIRDGKVRLPKLPILYELPERLIRDDGWKQRKLWPLVNPNFGRSVRYEFLDDQLASATIKGRDALNLFASQHLNVEVGSRQADDCWAGAPFWAAAADSVCRTLEEILDRSEVVTIGIDGGGLDDLLGLAVLGREKGTRRWLLWCHAWCHESALEQRKSLITIYRDLEAAGELTIVQEMPEDLKQVGDICEQVLKSGLLSCVGVDQIGLGGIVDELAERGITTDEGLVVGIKQGFWLSGTIKWTERKIADGTMKHGGQRIMQWCVDNAKIELRGNAILVTKQASGTGKIDPLMATFSAVQLMALNPEPKNPQSIYDNPVAYPKRSAEPEPTPDLEWRAPAPEPLSLDWSPEILADTQHPEHERHLKLFRRWQDLNADDD